MLWFCCFNVVVDVGNKIMVEKSMLTLLFRNSKDVLSFGKTLQTGIRLVAQQSHEHQNKGNTLM